MSNINRGYLAEVEASYMTSQAMPGAVVLQLTREIDSEIVAGREPRRMFIELTLSEAVQHWRHMGVLVRRAGALASQPPHVDIAVTL